MIISLSIRSSGTIHIISLRYTSSQAQLTFPFHLFAMHEKLVVCVQSVDLTMIMALEMAKEAAMKAIAGALGCAWTNQGGGKV